MDYSESSILTVPRSTQTGFIKASNQGIRDAISMEEIPDLNGRLE